MGGKQPGNGHPPPGSTGAEPGGAGELSARLFAPQAEQINTEILHHGQVNIAIGGFISAVLPPCLVLYEAADPGRAQKPD